MAERTSRVALKKISIEGYRSIRRAEFSPHSELSVLIGPNGAGKTSLLNAVGLLRHTTSGTYGRHKVSAFSKRSNIEAEFQVAQKRIGYRAELVLSPTERNADEVVELVEKWNFTSALDEANWQTIPRAIFDPRIRRQYLVQGKWLMGDKRLSEEFGDYLNRLPKSVDRAISSIFAFKSSIAYYSASRFTDPSKCPSSFEIEDDGKVLESYADRGAHLSFMSGLYGLFREDKAAYESYVSLVGPSGIGLISNINWNPIELSSSTVEVRAGGKLLRRKKKRVLIVPMVKIGRTGLSFNQLSEGTFRALALLFYLVTKKDGLLLIEEPEVCVHHGLLKSVIEAVKAHAKNKQIIISTHSELVLDSVRPENVFPVRNQAIRGTTVRPLSGTLNTDEMAAMKEYLRTTGSLGEYWTHGGLS